MRSKCGVHTLALVAGIFASGVTRAADSDIDADDVSVTAPWLSGDWGGIRTRLLQRGIAVRFGYVNELAYNAQGGTKSEVVDADQYLAGVTLDLDRLIGIHGGLFQVSVTQRTGRNLSDDSELGTLQEVQEIFGRGRTARLTEFWFEQKYLDGLVEWKIGRAPFGDFAAFECNFQNLTFCGPDPGNVITSYIWNWPISQWMTRFKFTLNRFGYIQFGIFDDNPKYLGKRDALLPVFFARSTGALVPAELAWLPAFGGGTLPGSYKFGAWYDTSKASDVVDVIGTVAVTNPGTAANSNAGRYGGYINFKQQITHNGMPYSNGGLSVFLNAVFADSRTSIVDRQIAGGVVYTGPLSWRPHDDIAFAVGTTHVNNRVAKAEARENALGPGRVGVQGSEYVFELDYTVRPIEGLLIRPNVQYVLDPGGTGQKTNNIVFGLKTVGNF